MLKKKYKKIFFNLQYIINYLINIICKKQDHELIIELFVQKSKGKLNQLN